MAERGAPQSGADRHESVPVTRIDLKVEGLDCAEEVLLLKRELEGRSGIQDLDFDVLNARMTVAFDPAVIDDDSITQRIAALGMRAHPWVASRRDATPPKPRDSRFAWTTACGVLLVLGAISSLLANETIAPWFGGFAAFAETGLPWLARGFYGASLMMGLRFVVPKAWVSLRSLRPDMNLLMSFAVCGAVLLGEWLEAAMVAFLFAVALLLEQWSLGRARRAIAALMSVSPPTARCRIGPAGQLEQKRVEDVAVGTIVVVQPGEKIPLDGAVRAGTTTVNEAPITGESLPVSKQPGDLVYAGTINQDGTLEFETTRPPGDTALAHIVRLVEQSQRQRAPTEQWVESFARYYTPAMMALAAAVALIPPLLLSRPWTEWAYNGLVLLVIACPCALVISTPVSIVSAMTSATRNGVLVKGGRYLEAAAGIRAVALDKTGTITCGRLTVEKIVPLNGHTPRELLERAAAMETHSPHPLARAILERAVAENIQVPPADEYHIRQGLGAEGMIGGQAFWIGSHRFLHEKIDEPPEVHEAALSLEDNGHTVVAVGNDRHVCGLISLADRVREGTPATISAMRGLGIRHVAVLSGDNEKTTAAVARAAGVDSHFAELLPEDKVSQIELLRSRYGPVAMVGDGINDAPAMAAATLGIAMGAIGSDAAIETADVALMADDVARLPWLMAHARRTMAVIRQNVTFALGLKAVFVLLTLAGAASLWSAIAADTGASLLVIFNGMRLLKP